MDYATIARQAVKAAIPYIKAQIRRDAENLYSLKEDWKLPAINRALRDYGDEAFRIWWDWDRERSFVVVRAFESTREDPICDGASLAPDKVLGVDFVPAALFHDRWYGRMEAIAKAWGWGVADMRKLGDEIFASIVYAENGSGPVVRFLASTYYHAVRAFGGLYHKHGGKLRNLVLAILAAAVFAGCAGCVGSIFDPEDGYAPPVWEKVAEDAGNAN